MTAEENIENIFVQHQKINRTEVKTPKRIIVSPLKMSSKSNFGSNKSKKIKHDVIFNTEIEYIKTDLTNVPDNGDQKLDVRALSQIEKIPEEVLCHIFSFLNIKDTLSSIILMG